MRVGVPGANMGGRLAPVSEGPVSEEGSERFAGRSRSLRRLIRWKLPLLFQRTPQDDDLRVILSVLGCPLSPVSAQPLHCQLQPDNVSSKAEYIIRQFRATTGSAKMESASARSIYASGKLKMATVADAHGSIASAVAGGGHPCYEGCFVLWQMSPGMWLAEFMVGGRKVAAGSDGAVAWRRTPWHRTHAARGGTRPLRRFLQKKNLRFLDHKSPDATGAGPSAGRRNLLPRRSWGRKHVGDEECFVLKLAADHQTLSSRSDDTADIIKHVMLGYFSQKSGLLVYLEDSQITRVQPVGAPPAYWETTTRSHIGDYRVVDGVAVAHAGRSTVSLMRLGDGVKVSPEGTEMEETWAIDDVAFDVRGLSADTFILPEEIRGDCYLAT